MDRAQIQEMQVKILPVIEMMGINEYIDGFGVHSMQFAACFLGEHWWLEWTEK